MPEQISLQRFMIQLVFDIHHRFKAPLVTTVFMPQLNLVSRLMFFGDPDDKAVIRFDARENATQRGNHATAAAGSVAAAIRFLFKAQSLGALEFQSTSKYATKDQDIGTPTALAFLKDVPGVTSNTVQEQLANLKKSGNYARILEEVQVEVDEILRAEQEAIAKAAKCRVSWGQTTVIASKPPSCWIITSLQS